MNLIEIEWLKALAMSERPDYVDAYVKKDKRMATELIHKSTQLYADELHKKAEQYCETFNSFPKAGQFPIRFYDLEKGNYLRFMLFRKNCKLIFDVNTGQVDIKVENSEDKMTTHSGLVLTSVASFGPFAEVIWTSQRGERTCPEIDLKIAFNALIENSL